MKPAVVLIDLQNDFLRSLSLEPSAGRVIDGAVRLLNGARKFSIPVVHVWTTVNPDDDRRMPHLKEMNKWACVEGTDGHAVPERLSPLEGESVIHKTSFSAFSGDELAGMLRSLNADTLWLSGVHLHACVRTTALDAYQTGFSVFIAGDAVASDDPLHAAITRRYLEKRSIRFLDVEELLFSIERDKRRCAKDKVATFSLPPAVVAYEGVQVEGLQSMTHFAPARKHEALWNVPICSADRVSVATAAARDVLSRWKGSPSFSRIMVLGKLGDLIEAESEVLAKQMALEIGKPITQARGEVSRSVELLRAIPRNAADLMEEKCGRDSARRYVPMGVVAIITPWNNPLAIPLGKIGPALFYGNTVVWKPAPAGSSLALRLMEMLRDAGCPEGAANLVYGDRSTALALMEDPNVDAVSVTGSSDAGYSAQDICAFRHIPLQAELGGNNAAVVWADCELKRAVVSVAEAAFGFAGQRCTANRRVIVDTRCYDAFLNYLTVAVKDMVWGDPLEPATQIGPMISREAVSRVADLIERARVSTDSVITPHKDGPGYNALIREGNYFPPTIVCCSDPAHETVQEETFGPVLVVQRALDWDGAMTLCNGVKQGLVSALFSSSQENQKKFLEEAKTGILKINMGTADADAEAPFGGWKASGIGPPEHGESDREFYTRTQAIYKEAI